ncbi:TonB-dependent receptor [Sphingobium sp. AS12]|uniref:TonB-dependent receptor n=1 Tax=Sphingobium sp. AS12 TaxID=2849495 RepID=UPI001C31AA2C|nr:TonB-dependent receptor [Sphingobium sp. AS12]MBV2150135.1 TonB-dependent receptor [Sphingobium sp. AS12]
MRNFGISTTLAVVTAVLGSGAARAQDSAASTSPETGLGDIVVTARKTAERLQDVPLAVSAFSGDALERRGAGNIGDVAALVPNVTISTAAPVAGATTAAVFFIRGVGQTDFAPTTDPGVGLYVDGVYISRSVGSVLDLMDLDRIEVLRGPQGTLFGKNTIGGAINVVSREPSRDLSGRVQLETGSFDRFNALGQLSGGVSDTLRLGGVIQYKSSDGYVTRLGDGKRLGGDDRWGARIQAVWEPADRLKFHIIGDYSKVNELSGPITLLYVDGTAQFAALRNMGAGCLPLPGPVSNPNCWNTQWVTGDPRTTYASKPPVSTAEIWGISGTAELTRDWGTLKSITSYRDSKAHFTRDSDGSPLAVFETEDIINQWQFSQELQYLGSAFEERLKWVTGLYYFKEKGQDINNVNQAIVLAQSGGFVANESYAAYGQVTWTIVPRLSLTAGLRYTHERRAFTPDQIYLTDFMGLPAGARVLPFEENAIKANEWTPLATLSYKLAEDVMAYATFSRGFKSGGFVQRNVLPLAAAPSYDPEFVNNYEIGLKSSWLDNRLRFNAALFRMDYSDMQVTVLDGVAPQVRNAASARINGAEAEIALAPVPGLLIEGSLGYLDAKYTQIGPTAIEVSLDSKFPFVPKWTASIGAQYALDLGIGTLTTRTDLAYRSRTFFDAANVPLASQDGYATLNLSASFATSDGHWQITVAGTNLTDKLYLLSAYPSVGTSGYVEGTYAKPAEWSLKLAYRF